MLTSQTFKYWISSEIDYQISDKKT